MNCIVLTLLTKQRKLTTPRWESQFNQYLAGRRPQVKIETSELQVPIRIFFMHIHFPTFEHTKKRDGIFRSPERRRESLVKFLIGYYKDRELTTNPICVSIASIRGIRRESATTSLIKKKFGICRADGIPLNSSIVWKFPDFDV